MMIGAEFLVPKGDGKGQPAAEYVGELEQLAFTKGLLLLSCGVSTIRFAPPLVLTEAEAMVGLDVLEQCLVELDRQFGIA